MKIDPKEYGVSSQTHLEKIDSQTIAVIINRKSRIIMADGKRILKKSEAIKTAHPRMNIVLKTTAPLCSKTKQYLEGEGIRVSQD